MKKPDISRALDWAMFIVIIELLIVLTAAVVALIIALFGSNAEAKAPLQGPPVIEDKLFGEDKPAEGSAELTIGEPLGEFKLTAYCPCAKCCGKTDGITATGTTATEGRTIAVDPRVIPYGSTVTIYFSDGTLHSYIAEDCGGGIKGNRLDIYFNDHQTALQFGVQRAYVYMEETNG